jgi:nucleoside-diphosphate-sugar epimerase
MIATFGRNGFIGSYLPPEFVGIDVDVRTHPDAWPTGKGFESAVNLACVQPARGKFPLGQYLETNVGGLQHILKWARWNDIRKVIAVISQKTSTEGEIGKLARADSEAMAVMGQARLEYHMGIRGNPIVLRLPPVIGPGPYIAKSGLGQMIEGAKQGRIEVWGNPSNSRAVVSVHDAVSAIQFLVKSDLQGVYSIGIDLSLESEVKAVQEVFGGELVYRPEIDNGIRQDIEVSGIPGWEPRWTFREMVRELKGAEGHV